MALTEKELNDLYDYLTGNPKEIRDNLTAGYAKGLSDADLWVALLQKIINRIPDAEDFSNKDLFKMQRELYAPLARAASQSPAEFQTTVKDQKAMMELYMERYLQELYERKDAIKGKEEADKQAKQYLQNKIDLLKALQKDFHNPKKPSVLRSIVEEGNFMGDAGLLVYELHRHVFTHEERAEDEELQEIFDAVAGHFLLDEAIGVEPGSVPAKAISYPSGEQTAGTFAPKGGAAIHFSKLIQEKEALASRAKKATQSLFSKAHSKMKGVEEVVEVEEVGVQKPATHKTPQLFRASIQKDLDKIKELYAKELDKLWQAAERDSDEETALRELGEAAEHLKLSADEFLADASLTKAPDAVALNINKESFVLAKLLELQPIKDYDNLDGMLKDIRIGNQLIKESAPKANQALIKKVDKQIRALEKHVQKEEETLGKIRKEQAKLRKKPKKNAEALVKLKTKKTALKNAHIQTEETLSHHDEAIRLLSNPEKTTQAKSSFAIRELFDDVLDEMEDSPENKDYQFLAGILDEALKMYDPYYKEIKELDDYIAKMEKDIHKKPVAPKERENAMAGEITDRERKLQIAKDARDILLPVDYQQFKHKEAREGQKEKELAQVDALEQLVADNKKATKGYIGSGTLDGILKRALHKKHEQTEELHKARRHAPRKK